MKIFYKEILGTICFTGILFSAVGQVKTKTFEKGIPRHFLPLKSSISKIKTLKPSAEFYKLKVKAQQNKGSESKTDLPKMALSESVYIDFLKEAEYANLDGISTYALTIKAHDAINLSIRFGTFFLSPNALLSIYNDYELTDSITSKENNEDKSWLTRTYNGNTLNIVLRIPTVEKGQSILKIKEIDFGYLKFGSPGASGSCNINVACSLGSGWDAERNSVALIKTANNGTASGVLVMNTCGFNIPYFLTAKHVIDQGGNPLSNWVFQFFYFSTSCSTNTGYREDVQFNGATLKAINGTSDFALLELSQTPSTNSGIYYSGWNRTSSTTAVTSGTGLHHPSADVMKISRTIQPISRSNTSFWRVYWTQGVTEPTSSGSPLYDQSHRVLGQLQGGYSSCTNLNEPDDYGSFDYSWSGGGTNSTRLSNWLDL